MTLANASLRAFLFLSFTLFLLPVIGNAQSPATPEEQKEVAVCFQNLLDALIAKDGTRAARYVDQATFDRLHRLKLLALEGKPSEITKLDTLEQIRVFKMRRIFTAAQLTAVPEWLLFADDALLDNPWLPRLEKFTLGPVTIDGDGFKGELMLKGRSSKMKMVPFVRFSRENGELKCETRWLEKFAYHFLFISRYFCFVPDRFSNPPEKRYADPSIPPPDPWQPLRRRR